MSDNSLTSLVNSVDACSQLDAILNALDDQFASLPQSEIIEEARQFHGLELDVQETKRVLGRRLHQGSATRRSLTGLPLYLSFFRKVGANRRTVAPPVIEGRRTQQRASAWPEARRAADAFRRSRNAGYAMISNVKQGSIHERSYNQFCGAITAPYEPVLWFKTFHAIGAFIGFALALACSVFFSQSHYFSRSSSVTSLFDREILKQATFYDRFAEITTAAETMAGVEKQLLKRYRDIRSADGASLLQYAAQGRAFIYDKNHDKNVERMSASHSIYATHRTIPRHSIIRITNLQNGHFLEAPIDSAAHREGNLIGVSPRAAKLLAFRGSSMRVLVQLVGIEDSRTSVSGLHLINENSAKFWSPVSGETPRIADMPRPPDTTTYGVNPD